jgi:streptogramin lyase
MHASGSTCDARARRRPLAVTVALAAALCALCAFGAVSAFATPGEITYYGGAPYQDPFLEYDHLITAGNDGNMWFAEVDGIGKASTSGVITPVKSLTEQPIALAADPAKEAIWYVTEDGTAGRLKSNGGLTTFGGRRRDVARGETYVWFTRPEEHKVEYDTEVGGIPAGKPCAVAGEPVEVAVAGGYTYATEPAGEHPKIAKVWVTGTKFAETTCHVTEYALDPAEGEPTTITNGPEGKAWFAMKHGDVLGSIDSSGTVTYHALPSNIGPTTLAYGAAGRLWFNDGGMSFFGSMDATGATSLYWRESFLPTAFAPGPDGKMWFTDEHRGVGKFTVE